eukprot:1161666-Pelagomonas_calceolata.AAC.10
MTKHAEDNSGSWATIAGMREGACCMGCECAALRHSLRISYFSALHKCTLHVTVICPPPPALGSPPPSLNALLLHTAGNNTLLRFQVKLSCGCNHADEKVTIK